MDVFLTQGRTQRVVAADPATAVSAFAASNGIEGDLYLGDAPGPLDPRKSLGEQSVKEGSKLVAARCRQVAVTIRFAGQPEKTDSFPPGAAIQAVFVWAVGKKGFDLPKVEAAKHTLQVCGSTDQPDASDHLGSWADERCTVCFDLVPKQKFEG